MEIEVLNLTFSICKLPDGEPPCALGTYCFTGRTDGENSLVCATRDVPASAISRSDGWRAMRVRGPLDFSLTGILAGISQVLAREQIGIFAVSTFDTDYIFTRAEQFDRAVCALSEAGYAICQAET